MNLLVTARQQAIIDLIEEIFEVDFAKWCDEEKIKPTKFSACEFINIYFDKYLVEIGLA